MFRFTTLALVALTSLPVFAVSTPRTETRTLAFGEPAVIQTAVLRATGIVLATDERLKSYSQPDGERWQIDWSDVGPEGATTPILTVTPSDCGLATNLLVFTTRRVYALTLESAPCNAARDLEIAPTFDQLVRFRYPDEELTKEIASVSPPPLVRFAAPLEELVDQAGHFVWQAKHGYRGPKPALITTDGTSTYVVFPKGSFRGTDLPLFFLVNEQGERELVTFEVEGTTFIVRTVFDKAVLLAGGNTAKRQPHLLISRRG